jgi:CRISPR-associated protein Cmr3
MTIMLELTCRDPIVSRDGRPFGAGQGNRMRGAGWLLPSVVAGSLRSTIGKAAERDFSVETAHALLQVEVAGLFPLTEGTLYLPAPQDCVLHPTLGPLRAAPQAIEDAGCDWPVAGLRPVALTYEQAPEEFKPMEGPAWWPVDRYGAWLTNGAFGFDDRFLRAPETEYRTHVQLDPGAGTAEDGNLFTTAALPLTHLRRHAATADASRPARFAAITLAGRVRGNGWCAGEAATLNTLHPLGGERRLVHWRATAETSVWDCPREVREALSSASRIRMVLTTPAVFADGWTPAWLNESLIGTPPGAKVTLKLVGVSIARWRAVSGWSLANLPNQPRGPKPVKRVVPAGGVYFFETVDGSASDLADRWLEPVSDDEQDCRDGFGLAVWGVW